ncbi:dihydrolipoamide acetyltransferase family protein [Bradyrhizobium sp. DASA03120]|uniref:dihydrolipoamide acetyltransferase family protein n=1 Tax=Bradyrhizobium sp. SMVTL-02 TaxID=3395917 RepID=UPI003F729665
MTELTVKLPDVGEGIAEAELVELHVKVGDVVREDDVLAAVMTDKATVEIPSPYGGIVQWVGAGIGDKIAVGSDLIRLGTQTQFASGIDMPPASQTIAIAATNSSPESHRAHKDPTKPLQQLRVIPVGDGPSGLVVANGRPLAAPSVRQHARDLGIDLGLVSGSGPGGRILYKDVQRHASRGSDDDRRLERTEIKEIKVVGLRRKIAERMTLSNSRIPHITIVEEVDVTAIEELRASLNKKKQDVARLTFLPFLMRAMVKALGIQPQLNVLFDDDAGIIRQHAAINIGIAQHGYEIELARHGAASGRRGHFKVGALKIPLLDRCLQEPA